MFEYIAITGLIIGAGLFVLNPLLRSGRGNARFDTNTDNMLAQLNLKKENAYEAIRELEFDLSMKKLSEDDFETLKAQYMNDALKCMKAIDNLHMQRKKQAGRTEKDLGNETEKEISARHTGDSLGSVEIFCTRCGQGASPKDGFCVRCGARLMTS